MTPTATYCQTNVSVAGTRNASFYQIRGSQWLPGTRPLPLPLGDVRGCNYFTIALSLLPPARAAAYMAAANPPVPADVTARLAFEPALFDPLLAEGLTFYYGDPAANARAAQNTALDGYIVVVLHGPQAALLGAVAAVEGRFVREGNTNVWLWDAERTARPDAVVARWVVRVSLTPPWRNFPTPYNATLVDEDQPAVYLNATALQFVTTSGYKPFPHEVLVLAGVSPSVNGTAQNAPNGSFVIATYAPPPSCSITTLPRGALVRCGSAADMTAAFAYSFYQADANYWGTDTVGFEYREVPTGSTTFSFAFDDWLNTIVIPYSIAPVNDPPLVVFPIPAPPVCLEGGNCTVTGAKLDDVDAMLGFGAQAYNVEVYSVEAGTTQLVLANATLAAAQTLFAAGVPFVLPGTFNGNLTFTLRVNDSGYFGKGGAQIGQVNFTVLSLPVNTPPTLTLPARGRFGRARLTPLPITVDDVDAGRLRVTVSTVGGTVVVHPFFNASSYVARGGLTLTPVGTTKVVMFGAVGAVQQALAVGEVAWYTPSQSLLSAVVFVDVNDTGDIGVGPSGGYAVSGNFSVEVVTATSSPSISRSRSVSATRTPSATPTPRGATRTRGRTPTTPTRKRTLTREHTHSRSRSATPPTGECEHWQSWEYDCPCGFTRPDTDGDGIPDGECTVCVPGYMLPHCRDPCPCNGHGSCNATTVPPVRPNGTRVWNATVGQVCRCDASVFDGYFAPPSCAACMPTYYPEGQCTVKCTPQLCSSHGSCLPSGACNCTAPYVGANCDKCPPGFTDYAGGCLTCEAGRFGPQCAVLCDRAVNCSAHGSCSPTGTTCICDANFTGSTCGGCISGMGGAQCDVVLRGLIDSNCTAQVAPPSATAAFDASNAAILVSWSAPTDRGARVSAGGDLACDKWIVVPASGAMGDGPQCWWSDDVTLRVALGPFFTLRPGATLELRGGVVSALAALAPGQCGLPAPQASVVVGGPSPSVLSVGILAPAAVGECDASARFSAAATTASSPVLEYAWGATVAAAQFGNDSVPFTTVPVPPNGTSLTAAVRVRDWMGVVGTATVSVPVLRGLRAPPRVTPITALDQTLASVYAKATLMVTAAAPLIPPMCRAAVGQLRWVWEVAGRVLCTSATSLTCGARLEVTPRMLVQTAADAATTTVHAVTVRVTSPATGGTANVTFTIRVPPSMVAAAVAGDLSGQQRGVVSVAVAPLDVALFGLAAGDARVTATATCAAALPSGVAPTAPGIDCPLCTDLGRCVTANVPLVSGGGDEAGNSVGLLRFAISPGTAVAAAAVSNTWVVRVALTSPAGATADVSVVVDIAAFAAAAGGTGASFAGPTAFVPGLAAAARPPSASAAYSFVVAAGADVASQLGVVTPSLTLVGPLAPGAAAPTVVVEGGAAGALGQPLARVSFAAGSLLPSTRYVVAVTLTGGDGDSARALHAFVTAPRPSLCGVAAVRTPAVGAPFTLALTGWTVRPSSLPLRYAVTAIDEAGGESPVVAATVDPFSVITLPPASVEGEVVSLKVVVRSADDAEAVRFVGYLAPVVSTPAAAAAMANSAASLASSALQAGDAMGAAQALNNFAALAVAGADFSTDPTLSPEQRAAALAAATTQVESALATAASAAEFAADDDTRAAIVATCVRLLSAPSAVSYSAAASALATVNAIVAPARAARVASNDAVVDGATRCVSGMFTLSRLAQRAAPPNASAARDITARFIGVAAGTGAAMLAGASPGAVRAASQLLACRSGVAAAAALPVATSAATGTAVRFDAALNTTRLTLPPALTAGAVACTAAWGGDMYDYFPTPGRTILSGALSAFTADPATAAITPPRTTDDSAMAEVCLPFSQPAAGVAVQCSARASVSASWSAAGCIVSRRGPGGALCCVCTHFTEFAVTGVVSANGTPSYVPLVPGMGAYDTGSALAPNLFVFYTSMVLLFLYIVAAVATLAYEWVVALRPSSATAASALTPAEAEREQDAAARLAQMHAARRLGDAATATTHDAARVIAARPRAYPIARRAGTAADADNGGWLQAAREGYLEWHAWLAPFAPLALNRVRRLAGAAAAAGWDAFGFRPRLFVVLAQAALLFCLISVWPTVGEQALAQDDDISYATHAGIGAIKGLIFGVVVVPIHFLLAFLFRRALARRVGRVGDTPPTPPPDADAAVAADAAMASLGRAYVRPSSAMTDRSGGGGAMGTFELTVPAGDDDWPEADYGLVAFAATPLAFTSTELDATFQAEVALARPLVAASVDIVRRMRAAGLSADSMRYDAGATSLFSVWASALGGFDSGAGRVEPEFALDDEQRAALRTIDASLALGTTRDSFSATHANATPAALEAKSAVALPAGADVRGAWAALMAADEAAPLWTAAVELVYQRDLRAAAAAFVLALLARCPDLFAVVSEVSPPEDLESAADIVLQNQFSVGLVWVRHYCMAHLGDSEETFLRAYFDAPIVTPRELLAALALDHPPVGACVGVFVWPGGVPYWSRIEVEMRDAAAPRPSWAEARSLCASGRFLDAAHAFRHVGAIPPAVEYQRGSARQVPSAVAPVWAQFVLDPAARAAQAAGVAPARSLAWGMVVARYYALSAACGNRFPDEWASQLRADVANAVAETQFIAITPGEPRRDDATPYEHVAAVRAGVVDEYLRLVLNAHTGLRGGVYVTTELVSERVHGCAFDPVTRSSPHPVDRAGSGSLANPYVGLGAALGALRAGDTVVMLGGTYPPQPMGELRGVPNSGVILIQPYGFVAPSDDTPKKAGGKAVFDLDQAGGGAAGEVVTIAGGGLVRVVRRVEGGALVTADAADGLFHAPGAEHVVFQGLAFAGADVGVNAPGSRGVSVYHIVADPGMAVLVTGAQGEVTPAHRLGPLWAMVGYVVVFLVFAGAVIAATWVTHWYGRTRGGKWAVACVVAFVVDVVVVQSLVVLIRAALSSRRTHRVATGGTQVLEFDADTM